MAGAIRRAKRMPSWCWVRAFCPQARKADAIVVLGSGVLPSGAPSLTLRARTLHAVALYKQGLAKKIICTGGIGDYPPAEARAAAGLAHRRGVPARDLVLEDKSTSTWENALYTARLCRRHGWQSVILASDGYHLWRAHYLFDRAGLKSWPSPAPDSPALTRPWRRAFRTAREAILTVRDALWRR
jgi:uncharacterized SAM-binding protein YcdF (DUF218 family)